MRPRIRIHEGLLFGLNIYLLLDHLPTPVNIGDFGLYQVFYIDNTLAACIAWS